MYCISRGVSSILMIYYFLAGRALNILYALPGEMVYCQHKDFGRKVYIKIFHENNSVNTGETSKHRWIILRLDCK